MRKILILALAFGLSCAVVASALAQGTSALRGVVADEQGGVLPGVTVVATHAESGTFRQTVTGPGGEYSLASLQPGPYNVTAQLPGFMQLRTENVVLQVGPTVTLNLTLQLGALEETVTVTGESPLVDLTSSQVGGNVDTADLQDLPSSSRNFTSFVALLPGVQLVPSSSPSSSNVRVNSQSGSGITFLMDGGNNNDDLRGGSSGAQAKPALEAVAEFEVVTNQFDAEYSSAVSGVVNAISKTGTNTFHGSAFTFYTDAGLTSKDYFVRTEDLEKPDTTLRQMGGTLGGPILRDKMHFFVSYERLDLDLGESRFYPTRPDLNFSTVQESNFDNYLGRIDHQVSSNHNYSVRLLWDHQPTFDNATNSTAESTLDTLTNEKDDDWTLVGTHNWVIGTAGVNTLRGSYTYERPNWGTLQYHETNDQTLELPTIRLLSGMDLQADDYALDRVMKSIQVDNNLSWFIPTAGGDHDLKFGFQYNNSRHQRRDQIAMNGVFQLATDRNFNAADPSTYPERLSIRGPVADEPFTEIHSFGVFAQDKWQLDQWTLSLGLRYDLQHSPIQPDINPLFDDPSFRPIDKNNFAPRAGFAYDIDGNSVFRGGYGRFYERLWVDRVEPFVRFGVFANSFEAQFPVDDIDPGPSLGQFPTDPLLVNGPVLNRALVSELLPPGTVNRNTSAVWFDNPDRRIAYQDQVTLGYERELGRQISVGADYVHMWGHDLPLRYDLNPAIRAGTDRTDPIIRTDFMGFADQLGLSPFSSSVYIIETNASSDYDGASVYLEKRFSNSWAGRASYTIGYARGNNDGDPNDELNVFQVGAERNLDLLWGPSQYDRRHLLTLSGRTEIPGTGGVTLSAVGRVMSGTPFTIEDSSFDPDRNGISEDPLPAGTYSGVGENALTVENDGGLRGAYGPSYFQLDMRVGYRVRLGGEQTFDFFGEIFNVTNHVNFNNPTGDRRSSGFLVPSSLVAGGYPRQFQAGLRYGF